MFFRRTRSNVPNSHSDLQKLDFGKLPILNAQQLVKLLGLESRLKAIEKLTGAGSEYYQLLYEPALYRYLESVQLLPATAAHHHAGAGGLAIHTLDVMDFALRKRKSYNLPQQSVPEIIAQQEHVWTYAVFAGSLLHNIDKLVVSTRILLDSGLVWTPHQTSILKAGAKHYTVTFDRTGPTQSTSLNNGFLHLLPPHGRGWLADFPEILMQLTAWLAGNHYEWGVIGEIVRQADSESVARNLKLGGDRKRFPNAPAIPLVDKLTTALRQLLDENRLKMNRPEHSAGWCDGAYTYLVCSTIAEAVRSQLQGAGASDVPIDNASIFDTWEEHGFIESTPEGGAVWHLTIDGGFTHEVLKFETGRIFHPSRRPETFTGSLAVSAHKPDSAKPSTASASISTPSWIVGTSNSADVIDKPHGDPAIQPGISTSKQHDTESSVGYRTAPAETQAAQAQATAPLALYIDNYQSAQPQRSDDFEIAHHFLNWLKAGLRDNRILVNRTDAWVHVVSEGILVVSPGAFECFANQFCLIEKCDDTQAYRKLKATATTAIQKRLERLLVKKKLHQTTEAGLNIHTYLTREGASTSKIRGWLLPTSLIFEGETAPNPNPHLRNLSGFKESTQTRKKNHYFLDIGDD